MIPLKDDAPNVGLPVITTLLVAVCAVVGFAELVWFPVPDDAFFGFGLIPGRLLGDLELADELWLAPAALTTVTYQFLHGDLMHLVGNAWVLWIYGRSVEGAIGRARYAALYALGGVGAALAHAVADAESPVPLVGASGSVAAVSGAYLALFPYARLLMWGGPIAFWLPAVVGLAGWLLVQVLAASADQPGVGWLAHIGGFVAGVALVVVLRPPGVPLWGDRRDRTPPPPPPRRPSADTPRPYTPGIPKRSLKG